METILLILYLIVAIAMFFIPEKHRNINPILPALLHLGAFGYFMLRIPAIASGTIFQQRFTWIPELDINLEFTLDGLSLVFALLITAIGFLVFLYSRAYMKNYSFKPRFYFYLAVFSGAMLGLVISTNMVQLFIFWELTSVLSFLLISFFNEKASARKAAFQSFFITTFGGLSLLAGIILIGNIADSYVLSDWIAQSDQIKSSNLYLPSLLLILVGVFTKSAQFPFHFWLPGAMHAPTPVSVYLHSATMVKAGIFLLARLNPVLGGTNEWSHIIPVVGVVTMLVGAYLSITQKDIKIILAYTTISALGLLVLLFGIDTNISIKAAFVFLFVHAFYKASLFMIAGYVENKAGTRDIDLLGGLARLLPYGFPVAVIALFSMAGLPPLLGFIGKELIYEAKVQSPGLGFMVLIMGVISNILMVTISLFFLFKVFFGNVNTFIKRPKKIDWFFLFGPGVLAIFSLGLGLYPGVLSGIIEHALATVRAEPVDVELQLWHGVNQVFLLSLFTVVMGVLIFLAIYKNNKVLLVWRKINDILFGINFSDVFSAAIDGFIDRSVQSTRLIQHGYHRYYILTIILFTSLLLWLQVYITRGWGIDTSFSLQPFYISGLIFIMMLTAIYSAVARSRMKTIIAMGITGYGISLIYLYYSAVDLAITQIIIETLTIVVFVLVLQKMPEFATLSKKSTRLRDALIALAFGSVMSILALQAIHVDFNLSISDFFIEKSLPEAFGKNVVNVILVDFRTLDTLGEITVLSIAAMGVYILLKPKKTNKTKL